MDRLYSSAIYTEIFGVESVHSDCAGPITFCVRHEWRRAGRRGSLDWDRRDATDKMAERLYYKSIFLSYFTGGDSNNF